MKKRVKYSFLNNFIFIIKVVKEVKGSVFFPYIALTFIGVLLPTLNAYIPKILLDVIENYSYAFLIISIVCLITVLMVGLNILNIYLSKKTDNNSQKLSRKFDLIFAEKVMNMNFELFEGPVGRNAYQKAKTSLGHYGVYSYLNYLFQFVKNIIGIVVYCIIISKINIIIVPAIIGVEILGGIFAIFIRQFENKLKNPKAVADRKLNYITNISKSFSASKDVRIYVMQDFLVSIAQKFLNYKKGLVKKGQTYYAANDVFASFLSLVITGGGYAYLIYKLFVQNLSAGDVVLYMGVIIGFTSWLSGAVDSVDSLLRANHAICDVRNFLDVSNDDFNSMNESNSITEVGDCEIEFINVSYKYPNSSEFALKNINLKISPKEKIAIVGYNGAGKTTLINLLCGLYKPTEGIIKVNGEDISKYNQGDYFSLFSLVFQDIRILPESLMSNITMRVVEESDIIKAKECAEKAGIAQKIESLNSKYETKLMKNINKFATEFSGGEAQKLAMARALYKDAPIMVLDEPTAALDPIAENEIYLKYNELVSNKTSIFISHRLSSTKFCDRIIFLSKAEIVEEGTHEQLMETDGYYAELYEIQSHYYKEMKEDR